MATMKANSRTGVSTESAHNTQRAGDSNERVACHDKEKSTMEQDNANMLNPDGSAKSEEQLWLEEILEKGMTVDEMIESLEAERPNTPDAEDIEWLDYSIDLLRRMQHS
jgi:hypothetical protein